MWLTIGRKYEPSLMGADSWVIYVRYIMVYPIWDDVLDDSQAL